MSNSLQGLSLDRFLGKQIMDAGVGSLSPFQGIMPYQQNNSSMAYNNPMNSYNQPATDVVSGTKLSNLLITTSQGGQLIPGNPLRNGRVQLGSGYTDSAGTQLPYDNLTAFHPTGIAGVVVFYGGIVMNTDQNGVVPTIDYNFFGQQYEQPICYGTGRVDSTGTPLAHFPSYWTVVRNSVGYYTITFTVPVPNDTYTIHLTPVGSSVIMNADTPTVNGFDILSYDNTGTLTDTDFSVTLFTTP